MKINLLVLKTFNPKALSEFYEMLGITFEHHRHGNGPMHYAANIEGVVFEIYPLSHDKTVDNTLRLGFTVENLDGVIEKITQHTGRVTKVPAITEWGRIAVVEDLDGRKIELKEAAI
ncbi:glyoxalase/bleomycin resistance/extradiol dioxygenase family protein [Chryseolinea sp. Jin1]|uniref:Glyoxalase/bleomycin resistance/extradiol dioxygenase family protein n=2 Tax=Chryseolinea lacunae TaxID=2801331 RepID=A0ABS1KMB7_9BACT|nr:glyoxalase/bleomycin resistance/extradiol dioxygenase family protein [Chryseolinea lacunae]